MITADKILHNSGQIYTKVKETRAGKCRRGRIFFTILSFLMGQSVQI